MFGSIFRFEVNYHRRKFLFYILCSVFFLLTFLSTTSDNVSIGPTFSNVNINAPIAVDASMPSRFMPSQSGVAWDFPHKTVRIPKGRR